MNRDTLKYFVIGFLGGVFIIGLGGAAYVKGFRTSPKQILANLSKAKRSVQNAFPWPSASYRRVIKEDFTQPVDAVSGQSFGKEGQLTFELFREGTFIVNGQSGLAWQRSDSYRDSAFIRSTKPLPKTYKITVVVGDIDYGLEKIAGLSTDPEYPEGPLNENGCYLLSVTDTAPIGHHTNIWWHQHRKLVIDVDNNSWGHGMPNPIFMVYFNRENTLVAYNGESQEWQKKWEKAASYEPSAWYRIELEKTKAKYIMSISHEDGRLVKRGEVPVQNVWRSGEMTDEYFVIGDPHENYYQGSMKIKSITMAY
ncbi:MAG: hypothetical protein Q8Q08_11840 [Candidatus Omnitrophota bacterium]|nr:hypothetical protein [Candidatus Omnitrophota bacterium]MDZ4241677.1 hypothetical protein [Candidatus Omnitrophota bacterium]